MSKDKRDEQAGMGVFLSQDFLTMLQPSYMASTLRHQKILAVIRELMNEGSSPDLINVAKRLESKQQLESIGGRVYLVELVEASLSVQGASQ